MSFVSPCCLPLVPGYLAAVSGVRPDGDGRRLDRRVLSRAAVFVASFSGVFILLGLGATAIGAFLFDHQRTLNHVAGGLMIAMGALFAASPFVLGLNRELRLPGLMDRAGRGGPVVAGAAFAVAWTPCVGPTLGAILSLSATRSGMGEGAALMAVYAAGLGLPFLLSAVAFHSAARSLAWVRQHFTAIQVVSGMVLMAMGVLVITGELFQLNLEVQRFLDRFGLNVFRSV